MLKRDKKIKICCINTTKYRRRITEIRVVEDGKVSIALPSPHRRGEKQREGVVNGNCCCGTIHGSDCCCVSPISHLPDSCCVCLGC